MKPTALAIITALFSITWEVGKIIIQTSLNSNLDSITTCCGATSPSTPLSPNSCKSKTTSFIMIKLYDDITLFYLLLAWLVLELSFGTIRSLLFFLYFLKNAPIHIDCNATFKSNKGTPSSCKLKNKTEQNKTKTKQKKNKISNKKPVIYEALHYLNNFKATRY